MRGIKASRLIVGLIMFLLMAGLFSQPVSAATLPPSLTIIVNFPPEDLNLSIRFADGHEAKAFGIRTAWEGKYQFDWHMLSIPGRTYDGAKLIVESDKKSFEYSFPAYLESIVYTLDMSNQSLTPGVSPFRLGIVIFINILVVLLAEGSILYAFQYRRKSSFITFIIVNLITHGGIYVLLPEYASFIVGTWGIGLILIAAVIIPIEMIAFSLTLKEHSKNRAVLYALTANIVSLALTFMLIFYLPI